MNTIDIITRKGEPFGKLTAYPITLRDYEVFQENKVCLTLMQKRIGIEFAQMPYLHMITILTTEQFNLLGMLGKVLSLVFRIDEEQIRINIAKDTGKVTLLIISQGGNPELIESISELRFNKLRALIAEQNNIKLPDERANLEILESEESIANMNSLNLEVNFKSLFFSVATYCGLSTEQMLDMTIYEFEERVSAISRISRYFIYNIGEMSGMVNFKNGNPCPSWCFDKKEDGLHGTIPLAQFQKQVGDVIKPV